MKEIIGYEGLYSINIKGDVWSFPKDNKYVKHLRGAWLKKTIDRGYEYVTLHKNKKQKKYAVHRLMCETFLEIDNLRNHVNHKNGIKNDNRLENLEWCTPKENCQHAWDNNLSKASKKMRNTSIKKMEKWNNSKIGKDHCSRNGKAKRKLSKEQVEEIFIRNLGGDSAYALAKMYPVSKQTILRIVRKETYKEFTNELQ